VSDPVEGVAPGYDVAPPGMGYPPVEPPGGELPSGVADAAGAAGAGAAAGPGGGGGAELVLLLATALESSLLPPPQPIATRDKPHTKPRRKMDRICCHPTGKEPPNRAPVIMSGLPVDVEHL
jgi:hypothetical protein